MDQSTRSVLVVVVTIMLSGLITVLTLECIYGPSYGFFSGEDNWIPEGDGGWTAHGHPAGLPPDQPSETIPPFIRLLPILVPAALLATVWVHRGRACRNARRVTRSS